MLMLASMLLASLGMVSGPATAQDSGIGVPASAGPLDEALPGDRYSRPGKSGVPASERRPTTPARQASLQSRVRAEQRQLERLPRRALQRRARDGERAAQVSLGVVFAREAEMLAFSQAAVRAALEDAARWYALAAARGFPGAPSLDTAGVRHHPIRAPRPTR